MKSFDQRLAAAGAGGVAPEGEGLGVAPARVPALALALPDEVWEDHGRYMTYCCRCEQAVVIQCDLREFEPGDYYCGGSRSLTGSPRCCP